MDNREIVYSSKFKLGTSKKYLVEELKDEENMKEYIASHLSHDLVKWLIENDYVNYQIEEGYYGTCSFNLINIMGEIQFKLAEVPRKYNRKILIESKKIYNKYV